MLTLAVVDINDATANALNRKTMIQELGHTARRIPIGTPVLACVAVLVTYLPAARALLIDLRIGALHLEWWRPLTGHLVHGSSLHLILNLSFFVPLGLLHERQVGTFRFLLECGSLAACVAGGVRLLHSSWDSYCGLSGVVYGLLTLVLLTHATSKRRTRKSTGATPEQHQFGACVVLVLAAKSIFEYGHGGWLTDPTPLTSSLLVIYLPGSHCAGIAAGLALTLAYRHAQRRDIGLQSELLTNPDLHAGANSRRGVSVA